MLPEDTETLDIETLLKSVNIADELDEETLNHIGRVVVEEYDEDLASREQWEKAYDEWMDLAMQVTEEKSYPWPNAANVKYPILTTAALQFGSRSYPALISGTQVVKGRIVGFDETGEKARQAVRVGKHMSYQLLEEMEDWEEDMDKLCTTLPIVGCMFKKTYFDSSKGINISRLVFPKDLVVDYWASSLEEANRKTHVLELSDNDIYERVCEGIYRDVELRKVDVETDSSKDNREGREAPELGDATPHIILEQHRYLDLDGDGYAEPYIVIVDEESEQVLRIVARFDEGGVKQREDGKIMRIEPVEYFTKYSFIPNPDGGFYDIGFGLLLSPINETVNTLINQLLDSGHLNTMQAGFISKGIRIKGGSKSFSPGEWKVANSTGDDLRKGIVPLPTKEPSNVLFTLLGMMIEGAQRLGSVTDILTGENPGQNQPATTTMAVIEQGLKVFSSIYKRMHRSMKKEFKKLYRLNSIYLPERAYFQILDIGEEQAAEIQKADYDVKSVNIIPQADPNVASESQRLIKAQATLELIPLGTVNPTVATQRVLEAQNQPGVKELMTMPEPQPNPEVLKMQDESERDWARIQLEANESKARITKLETGSILDLAKAEAAEEGTQLDVYMARAEAIAKLAEAKQVKRPTEETTSGETSQQS